MAALPDALRRALAGPLPGLDAQLRMAPRFRPQPADLELDNLRSAAALLLVYPHNGSWYVPVTVRGSGLRHHTGQVSLPGGRIDPGESVEEGALREAQEEVAIDPASVEVLRQLTPLSIAVSGHLLHPVLGLALQRPAFRVAEPEVERLIEVPVARLQDPNVVQWEQRTRSLPPHDLMDVPYFDVEDVRIWGATAMVLAEFLALLGELDV
ncbi:MAG: CoA pyrophosphatase [Acidobacteria bacterium]|nr:CoA pyrophosphatase [Acidobacteriota bacterium]